MEHVDSVNGMNRPGFRTRLLVAWGWVLVAARLTSPIWLSVLYLAAVDGMHLGFIGTVLHDGDIDRWAYVASVLGILTGLVSLHLVPAGVLLFMLKAGMQRWYWSCWLFPAAAFGFLWQTTVAHGDGLTAHEQYETIRLALAFGVPAGVTGFAWFLGWARFPSLTLRRWVALVVLVAGSSFNALVLTDYVGFHGMLSVFNTVLLLWLTRPWRQTSWLPRIGVAALALLMVSTVWMATAHEQNHRMVQRFSHVPTSLMRILPGGALWLHRADSVLSSLEDEEPEVEHQPLPSPVTPEFDLAVGRNVLLVVMEAVRSDVWADPEVTPNFHRWRQNGLTIPRAICQYPATPLAYGAMFTSQTPYVLIRSAHWGANRLFDHLLPVFDRVLASVPSVRWFEHCAITDFFLPAHVSPHRHFSAEQGLRYLQRSLKGLRGHESFFGWIHLYEPHDPYVEHTQFGFGKDRRDRYRSEVAYLDEQLGWFMDWFIEQPFAEETLLVIVGDHGQGLGEKINGKEYWGHHEHVHSVVAHIPLFIMGPGLPRGVTDKNLTVSQLDLMPTFFDFLGVDPPGQLPMQGQSIYRIPEGAQPRVIPSEVFGIRGRQFFDLLASGQWKSRKELDAEARKIMEGSECAPKLAIQVGQYKLVLDQILQQFRLYDVKADPLERRDLSRKLPDVLRLMKANMRWWQRRQIAMVERLSGLPTRRAEQHGRIGQYLHTTPPEMDHAVQVRFGDYAELIGYDLSPSAGSPGHYVTITWYFRALKEIPPGWRIFIHAHDAKRMFNLSHRLVDGLYPEQVWSPGQIVADEHRFRISRDLTGDGLDVYMGMWHSEKGRTPLSSALPLDEADRARVLRLPVVR